MGFKKLILYIACLHLGSCRNIRSADYYDDYFYDPEYLASSEYKYYDSEYDADLEKDTAIEGTEDDFEYYGNTDKMEYMQEDSAIKEFQGGTDQFNIQPNFDGYEYLSNDQESYTYDDEDYDYGDVFSADESKHINGHNDYKMIAKPAYAKRSVDNAKKESESLNIMDNSIMYNNLGHYDLRKHIMELISVYKKQAKSLSNDQIDYDDYDNFYSFENYYEFDNDNLKATTEKDKDPKTVYFDYIDIKDSLNFKKKWNGSR